jgi:site-specific recombinase
LGEEKENRQDASQRIALKIVIGDQEREVTYEELCLSNNLAQEALVRLLVKKNIFKSEELLREMEQLRKERYRSPGDLSTAGK